MQIYLRFDIESLITSHYLLKAEPGPYKVQAHFLISFLGGKKKIHLISHQLRLLPENCMWCQHNGYMSEENVVVYVYRWCLQKNIKQYVITVGKVSRILP